MPIINLSSVNLHYQTVGTNTVVVFVNGWTMAGDYWTPLAEQLAPKFGSLAYDGRGFGRSQPLAANAGLDIDDHAEDLHEILTKLNLKDVNLVAHGLGVWVAVLCARRHPQDIATITAIAPEYEGGTTSEIPSIWQQATLILKDLAQVPVLRNLITRRYKDLPEPYQSRLYENFAQAHRPAAFHMLASCMGNNNTQRLQQVLAEVTCPIMLVRGTEDSVCPATYLKELFQLIKAGKMATIRGGGHFPMLQFTNELAELLGSFFKVPPPVRKQLISYYPEE